MLAIKPSKKAFVGLICIAVTLLIVDGYLYYNRSSKLSVLQAELQVKSDKLENSTQIARRLESVETRYTDVQTQLGALEQGVSTRAYVPSLLRQLEDLGRNNNLRVEGVRPIPVIKQQPASTETGAKKPVEPYDKLNIEIQIVGNYWDIVSFIDQITAFPKIIAVREVQLIPSTASQSDKSKSSRNLLSAKLSTTAFILKNQTLPAKKITDDQVKVQAGQAGGA
ncbi:MAG: type IV pilus inner membrane component PilO [Armatimonadota bacterium]